MVAAPAMFLEVFLKFIRRHISGITSISQRRHQLHNNQRVSLLRIRRKTSFFSNHIWLQVVSDKANHRQYPVPPPPRHIPHWYLFEDLRFPLHSQSRNPYFPCAELTTSIETYSERINIFSQVSQPWCKCKADNFSRRDPQKYLSARPLAGKSAPLSLNLASHSLPR